MFPDVPEFNFPADISHFDFDPSPINQSIFLADTSVQPDLNPSPINQHLADVSNDNSIGTPSNNLPLRESTDIYIYIYIYIYIFFLCGFSFTNIHEAQDCRRRGRAFH